MTHKSTDLAFAMRDLTGDGWLSKNVIFDQLGVESSSQLSSPYRAVGMPFSASITIQIMLLLPSPPDQPGEAPFRAGALAWASVGLNHKGSILMVFSRFFGFTSF